MIAQPGPQEVESAANAQLAGVLARIVDSDQEALTMLYDILADSVYGLALRITNQVHLAEEVVQETFWQVWRQAPRFDAGRGTVKAWVLTIARSRAIDCLRQIEAQEVSLEDEENGAAHIAVADGHAPCDLLSALQEKNFLHAALSKLEPLPRQLISLAFFRGLSHDDIALHSGMPLGTVKSHIRRGLAQLQQHLALTATELNE